MRILQVHNYYAHRGGECEVVDQERRLLEARGHQVLHFTRRSADIASGSVVRKALQFVSIPYNRGVASDLRRYIRESQPDIAHVHNVFPLLSPSVYEVLSTCNIPVVQTIHNFRFLCPNGLFFRDGNICEACLESGLTAAIRHRCVRNSFPVSAAYTIAISLARRRNGVSKYVDQFIALNRFSRDRLVAAGFQSDRITICGNFIEATIDRPSPKKGYLLFIGRLSREKGLPVLLQALQTVAGAELVIAGTGPLEEALHRRVRELGLTQVRFTGYVAGEEKRRLIEEACYTVVPSVWYENFPVSVVESMAHGTPVIAARIGGLPEMVEPGKNGMLFESGNAADLSRVLTQAIAAPETVSHMARGALETARTTFSAERHYSELMHIYGKARDTRFSLGEKPRLKSGIST